MCHKALLPESSTFNFDIRVHPGGEVRVAYLNVHFWVLSQSWIHITLEAEPLEATWMLGLQALMCSLLLFSYRCVWKHRGELMSNCGSPSES